MPFSWHSPFYRSPADDERNKAVVDEFLKPKLRSAPHQTDIAYAIEMIHQALDFMDRPEYASECLENALESLRKMV